MGLFSKDKKKSREEQTAEIEQRFLDENFREELRNHGRWYFEKVINENAKLFKEDLDSTVEQINTELKGHIVAQLDSAIADVNLELKDHLTKQLEAQFAENSKTMAAAQEAALVTLTQNAQNLQTQYQDLHTKIETVIAQQQTAIDGVFEENKTHVSDMKASHVQALDWLNKSVQALHEQHEQLSLLLTSKIAQQESMLIDAFEKNMAVIVEHYLLGALGDQYDLKAQLPSIIKRLEENKQAIVDDMKL